MSNQPKFCYLHHWHNTLHIGINVTNTNYSEKRKCENLVCNENKVKEKKCIKLL